MYSIAPTEEMPKISLYKAYATIILSEQNKWQNIAHDISGRSINNLSFWILNTVLTFAGMQYTYAYQLSDTECLK